MAIWTSKNASVKGLSLLEQQRVQWTSKNTRDRKNGLNSTFRMAIWTSKNASVKGLSLLEQQRVQWTSKNTRDRKKWTFFWNSSFGGFLRMQEVAEGTVLLLEW
ncbi:hypothetical protein C1646_662026 [Rhizophagus diaphanus]|nr:hypothetical protein C1646_662026 [Rhizophagus diaphanus] [Rhizophagus sp. MUCL 43196]